MKRLLQINVTANWGSTGRIAEEIGEMAISQEWESYIAYGRGKPSSSSRLLRIGNDWDMRFHALQSRLLDNHGLASVKTTRRFVEQIKEIRPDIVHLHNIHGYFLNYPILFEALAQIDVPVIWTLHDCWAFTGHCAYYSAIDCDRWQRECHDCLQIGTYPVSWWMDRSDRNFRIKKKFFTSLRNLTLVPVSRWLENEVSKSFMGDCRIKVIHNGIDTGLFVPHSIQKSALRLEDKFLILGVASVWEDRKGLDDFIRLQRILSDDFQIVLIGLTEKQIRSLPKGILGISRTNSVETLVGYYSVADVFLNPTWEDNFPTTNLEALACGTPVITYRTGGSVEAVEKNTGFIVEQGDLESVVKKIECIRSLGKDSFSEDCRKRALELYDKRDRYVEYLKLYRELLGEIPISDKVRCLSSRLKVKGEGADWKKEKDSYLEGKYGGMKPRHKS
ncbi:glycosyltransferase [Parabacteroides sp.]